VAGELGNLEADFFERGILVALVEGLGNPRGDEAHFGFLHAARGECGCADANSRGFERRVRVVGNGILVYGDTGLAEGQFSFRAENAFLENVDKHQVIVSAAGDDAETCFLQGKRKRLGVADDLRGVGLEVGAQRFAKGHGLGGDDMHEWTALLTWEDGLVNGGSETLPGKDQAGARPAQRLVRGGSGDMRMGHRRGMDSACHQAGDVRHVEDIDGTHFVCDLAHARKIPKPWVGAAATDNRLGLFTLGDGFEFVVVDEFSIAPDLIKRGAVELAAEAEPVPVGEVAAVGEIEAENCVAGLQDRGIG